MRRETWEVSKISDVFTRPGIPCGVLTPWFVTHKTVLRIEENL